MECHSESLGVMSPSFFFLYYYPILTNSKLGVGGHKNRQLNKLQLLVAIQLLLDTNMVSSYLLL